MRILFAADVPPDPDSGAAGTEWQTIQALRRLGHEVDEIWAGDMPRRIRHGNLHYLLELPEAYRAAIRRRAEASSYDVYHVNQGHCYRSAREHRALGRPGVFVCRSHGLDDHMERVLKPWRRRLGIRGHGMVRSFASMALEPLLRRHDILAYRYASGVMVSSSLDRDYLVQVRGVEPARVAQIPQAPDSAFIETSAPPLDDERLFRILHVGGFAYWKGVHAVAAAANHLFAGSMRDRVHLTWVCRPEEHSLVRALLQPHAAGRVDLAGWMPQADLRGVYDSHGVFLAPSLFDGFGKVFLEAMARGLCVVGTPTGGMRDILRDGENGFLVGFNDAAAIVAAVERLWERPHLARRISGAATVDARRYSWDRVAGEAVGFYRRLERLGTRSPGRVSTAS